jgi:hypothetical protein
MYQKMPSDHVGVLVGGLVAVAAGAFGLYQLVTTRFGASTRSGCSFYCCISP